MRPLLLIWLAVVVVNISACTSVSPNKETPQIRVPIGIGFGVFYVLCDEVKGKWIPEKLQALKIPFEWTDQSEGLLSIGPITEESEDVYSTIRTLLLFLRLLIHVLVKHSTELLTLQSWLHSVNVKQFQPHHKHLDTEL